MQMVFVLTAQQKLISDARAIRATSVHSQPYRLKRICFGYYDCSAVRPALHSRAVAIRRLGSANEQQPRRHARQRQRRAVDAGRHGAARIVDGDAPQVARAEGVRLRAGQGA